MKFRLSEGVLSIDQVAGTDALELEIVTNKYNASTKLISPNMEFWLELANEIMRLSHLVDTRKAVKP